MNVSVGRGHLSFSSTVRKPSWLSVGGGGLWLQGQDTQTWTENALRHEHTASSHTSPMHIILLAVVVHSVPASFYTVFISIIVTLRVVSFRLNHCLYLSPGWAGLRPFSFTPTHVLAPLQSIGCLNHHSSPGLVTTHPHPRPFRIFSPLTS